MPRGSTQLGRRKLAAIDARHGGAPRTQRSGRLPRPPTRGPPPYSLRSIQTERRYIPPRSPPGARGACCPARVSNGPQPRLHIAPASARSRAGAAPSLPRPTAHGPPRLQEGRVPSAAIILWQQIVGGGPRRCARDSPRARRLSRRRQQDVRGGRLLVLRPGPAGLSQGEGIVQPCCAASWPTGPLPQALNTSADPRPARSRATPTSALRRRRG